MAKGDNKAKTEDPRVRIYLPLLESEGSIAPDQTEVVILNGNTTLIKRGEFVDVKPEVFIILKSKYPNL